MTKEEIDQKYLNQATQLEAKFFTIVNKDKPNQHRVLRTGKTKAEFDQRHGQIWQAHQNELVAGGFMELPTPSEPTRNLAAELDEIKAKIADYSDLKARVGTLEGETAKL